MLDKKEELNNAYAYISEKLGLPKKLVKSVYMSYWKAVREHIISLPLKEDLTDEEFIKLRPNVNIPSIGKFNITLERYKALKNNYNEYLNKQDVTHKED